MIQTSSRVGIVDGFCPMLTTRVSQLTALGNLVEVLLQDMCPSILEHTRTKIKVQGNNHGHVDTFMWEATWEKMRPLSSFCVAWASFIRVHGLEEKIGG